MGKDKPDYTKYYPPEPKPSISFKFQRYQEHVLMEEKDYSANLTLFKDYLAFPLEECSNRIHPLYKNPQKDMNSVRTRGMSSARSSGEIGQKGLSQIVSHQSEKEIIEKCQKFFSGEAEEDPDEFEDDQ